MTASVEPGARIRARDVLLASIWFGLVAGLIEGIVMTVRKYGFGTDTLMGPHVIWLAPVMDLLWLLLPGVALSFLVYFWRRPAATGLAMFMLAFSAGVAVCFLAILQLHTYALLVIALGIAVQVSAVIARHTAGFIRLTRRTTPVLALLVAVAAGCTFGIQRVVERRAIAKLPPAPAGAPNVLLLILDTARAMSMSVDGFGRPTTPALEEFARNGVNFVQALSPSSWTLPSHASMFTGYLPHQLSSGLKTPLDDKYPTLAEELTRRGYLTGGFTANLHYVSRDFGLARGFTHFADYAVSPGELLLNSSVGRYLSVRPDFRELIRFEDIMGRKNAARVDGELLSWLDGRKDGRPFFAFLNYYDVHEPYFPPAEFDRKFASSVPRASYRTDQSIRGARMIGKLRMTPAQMEREHEAYMGALNYLDTEIGRLLAEMKRRGLLENTVVIVAGDHGEQFGEHGYFVHGNSLYSPVMRVPLIISYPRALPQGKTVTSRLNLRDLAVTILDVTGTTPDRPFPGHSLRRFWDSTATPTDQPMLFEVITTGKPLGVVETLRSVVWGADTYIRHESGKEEAYNLDQDPGELHNLAPEPGFADRMAQLRSAMDSILTDTGPDVWGP
ncbi:MAG: sulfatase-like hydrolase/transferase [Gemmatimonadota bacterium]